MQKFSLRPTETFAEPILINYNGIAQNTMRFDSRNRKIPQPIVIENIAQCLAMPEGSLKAS